LPKEALYARCVADVQPRCPEANARGATIRIERIADKENRCFCEPIELGIARQYLIVPLINLERPPARRGDRSVLEKRKVKIRDAHPPAEAVRPSEKRVGPRQKKAENILRVVENRSLSYDERVALISTRANECKLRPKYTGPVLLNGDGWRCR
jgi:hypothetical protein